MSFVLIILILSFVLGLLSLFLHYVSLASLKDTKGESRYLQKPALFVVLFNSGPSYFEGELSLVYLHVCYKFMHVCRGSSFSLLITNICVAGF